MAVIEGIGNYVHARYANYLKYSITFKEETTPPSVQTIYRDQIAKIKAEANRPQFKPKDKAFIEKRLNMFFHPDNKTSKKNNTFSEKQIENIKSAVEQYIHEHFGTQLSIDFANLKVSDPSELFNFDSALRECTEAINNYNRLTAASSREVEGIVNRAKTLIKMRNLLGEKGFKSATIWRDLQTLDDELKIFEANVKEYVEKSNNTGIMIPTTFIEDTASGERFDIKVNRLIESLKTASVSKATGELAEAIVKAGMYVANKKGYSATQDILKFLEQSLKNTSRSNKGVRGSSISFFATYYANESNLFTSKGKVRGWKTLQGDQFTIQTTEDKVDATVDFTPRLKDVNLSIKNYNLASDTNITLLTGKNLLGLVQDYPCFVNHFLNIVGSHIDVRYEIGSIDSMHKAMKITALSKALIGGVVTAENRNKATDLFVVNDNSTTNGYKVYFLSDILNNVERNIELMKFDNYPSGYWNNGWIASKQGNGKLVTPDFTSAKIRITRLVNIMREMQLHISISKNALL